MIIFFVNPNFYAAGGVMPRYAALRRTTPRYAAERQLQLAEETQPA